MASILFRLGRFSFRHKWWVIAAWVAAMVLVVSLVSALQPKFSKDFELPGTDSGNAMTTMQKYFPVATEDQEQASTSVLVQAPDGIAKHAAEIDKLVASLKELPELKDAATIVSPLSVPAESRAQALSEDGKVGLIQVRQTTNIMDLEIDDKHEFVDILKDHRVGGLNVEATGSLMSIQDEGGTAEMLGFGVAFIVMIVFFGALVAAFIPLITGIFAVLITIMLLTLSTEFLDVNESATGIVTMLGIAVSIDYALFIVSRYRSEVARGGSREDAVGRAVGTAGSAVVFAGLTVIIAVVALMVIGLPFVTQMGLGAGIAVGLAVMAAITFIPALLGAFGRFAFTPKIPWIKHAEESEDADTNGMRFGRAVVAKPIPFIIAGLAVLVVAAIPMTKMELGMTMNSEDENKALELLAEGFGKGINGPLLVTVRNAGGDVTAAADKAVAHIKTLDDVANAKTLTWMGNGSDPKNPNVGADTALISIIPNSGPSDQETHDLMEQIRDYKNEVSAAGGTMHVGGMTAIMSDMSDKLDKALIPYLIVVVGLAFLIMVAVFRSLWVPLIGTIGFIFSGARRVRRHRGDLPGGHVRPDRQHDAAAVVPADLPDRRGVRPGHGLSGVHADAGPRGIHPRHDRQGGDPRRLPARRTRGVLGRDHHDLRVRLVHAGPRHHLQDARLRDGHRGLLRRHHHPHDGGARGDRTAGRSRLGSAQVAGQAGPRLRHRGRRSAQQRPGGPPRWRRVTGEGRSSRVVRWQRHHDANLTVTAAPETVRRSPTAPNAGSGGPSGYAKNTRSAPATRFATRRCGCSRSRGTRAPPWSRSPVRPRCRTPRSSGISPPRSRWSSATTSTTCAHR